jgi:hypothetical protein
MRQQASAPGFGSTVSRSSASISRRFPGAKSTQSSQRTETSPLRKLIGYWATYKGEHHKRVYGLPNVRVLTVVPGRKRIDTVIRCLPPATASIASPRLFLFAERPGLLSAPDFFAYEWTDAAGERRRLLD